MPWPPWSSSMVKRGFPKGSLLEGKEAWIWEALGQLPRDTFLAKNTNKKQVAIRKALNRLDLGWVATNTTPFRIAVGGLFDAAAKVWREEEEEEYGEDEDDRQQKLVQRPDNDHAVRVGGQSPQKRQRTTSGMVGSGPPFQIQSRPLADCPGLPNEIFKNKQQQQQQQEIFTSCHRRALWEHLQQHGAVVFPQAVHPPKDFFNGDDDNSSSPRPSLKMNTNNKAKPQRLRSTMGNGVAGNPPSVYAELDANDDDDVKLKWLRDLESRLWHLLLGHGSPYYNNNNNNNNKQAEETNHGATTTTKSNATSSGIGALPRRKSVLLQYGDGAENWAHQDNNREEIPVQAVVLLSDPSSFSGGEFYLAREQKEQQQHRDKNDVNYDVIICRNVVTWQSAGDVIVFMAGGDWWHGMMPVSSKATESVAGDTEDDNASTMEQEGFLRVAVGMLQPL